MNLTAMQLFIIRELTFNSSLATAVEKKKTEVWW